MPFSRVKDPLEPSHLALLQSVFDAICTQYTLSKIDGDAEALALILVSQLQNGVKSEAALTEIAHKLLAHRNAPVFRPTEVAS